MYAAHFGLTERPFSLAPDPRYLYLGQGHREALAHLLYGVGEGDSFVLLTGEVGTGKTTVCRALLDQLPADVDIAVVFNPRLTSVELLATVCDELRVSYEPGTTSARVLVDALSHALLAAHARGRRTVLLIDEAQSLRPEVLEEVRLLTNLETTREKLLRVILVGQPELRTLLDRPELRQLAQRITARYHLRPFGEADTCAYIQHRMAIAGQREPIFDGRAMRAAHRLSGGVPRLINSICDRALLGAYATGRSRVTAAIVRRAAAEVCGRVEPRVRWRRVAVVGAAAALLLAAAGIATLRAPAGVDRALASARAWAGLARPRVAPPPPAVVATTARPPRAEPALADVLGPSTAVRARAFTTLYGLWRVAPPADVADLGCDWGRTVGLRCLVRTGTWTVLRRLDLPAILPLVTADGERHWVVVAALDGDRATLDLGARRVTLRRAAIDPLWDGRFVALWRPPDVAAPIAPGMRGKTVAWLRQRLSDIDHEPALGGPAVYDEALTRRVMAFQRAHGLTADGVVGDESLVRLAVAAPGSGAPSLSTGR